MDKFTLAWEDLHKHGEIYKSVKDSVLKFVETVYFDTGIIVLLAKASL